MCVNNVLVAYICYSIAHFVDVRCENTSNETNWIPSILFSNLSSTEWFPRKEKNENLKMKLASPRFFGNDNLGNPVYEHTQIYRRDKYKAVPFSPSNQYPSSSGSIQYHTNERPSPPPLQQFYEVLPTGSQYSQPISNSQSGYYYSAPQYLPPPVPPSAPATAPQNLEDFSLQPPSQIFSNASNAESNLKSMLFVQPGKCSNSIEIGRVRDVEVKTSFKYGTDTQNGVCVLMLYSANELNKLAISLQAAKHMTNAIPWLETNLKMYAIRAGAIVPVYTKMNFGPNSPALILTRSNIVLLSFSIDGALDFFLDISTYQSLTC